MARGLLAVILCLVASAALVESGSAQEAPAFLLGFRSLADLIPEVAGRPVEAERHNPLNGDGLQQTTTGLMVWRKADNWTAFTDGSTTWLNGPLGLQARPNDRRFAWEAAAPAPSAGEAAAPLADPGLRFAALGPPRPVAPIARSPGAPRFGVAEAYASDRTAGMGIAWQRIVFSWADIQPKGPADWRADFYFPPQVLQRQLDRGVETVGLLQFTPAWAAANPADGQRAVPRNLSVPAGSPDNYWARFAGQMAGHYRGRINTWILWNEPDFKPGDRGGGHSMAWSGSDSDYYLLLKRGYQAIKAANPGATVVFAATSYWVDITMGRQPLFQRVLALAAADPEAKAGGPFFDAVAFNLYWSPDDLPRVSTEMRSAMKAVGFDRPLWLTETNAMPYGDPATPKAPNGQRVTLDQQADFAVQALALASAAGYQRVGWYKAVDGAEWRDQEAWGLLRNDGSARPAFEALRTALGLFSGARQVAFVPLERPDQPFGTPWPHDSSSYYPNWQAYQVIFDHPDGRRVAALWNATDSPLRVRIRKQGAGATLVDRGGGSRPLAEVDGWYLVDLAPATARGPQDPPGYHYVGGSPVLLVQTAVPADAPLQEPRLGEPGSARPGLALTLDPPSQKFSPGQTARFTLRLRGIEGFASPVQMSVPSLPAGATVDLPAVAYPGDRVPVVVRTDATLQPNLYLLSLQAGDGSMAAGTDLVLEVVP